MSLIVLKDADKAFTALYSNWFVHEKNWYSENFCNIDDDIDPDDIPIEKLKDCDYKNLRILESLNHSSIIIHQYNIGGDWNAGMSIYDMILQSPCKIIFICHGISASMGSIIPQAADVRRTMPSCDWLLHEGYTDIDSGLTYRQAKSWAQWEQKAYDKMLEIYVEASNLQASRIKSMFSKREDWWLSAEEAVANGFADAMLGEKGYDSIDSVKKNVS